MKWNVVLSYIYGCGLVRHPQPIPVLRLQAYSRQGDIQD